MSDSDRELMDRIILTIATNMPSPYALDVVWNATADGVVFEMPDNEDVRSDWEKLGQAVLNEVRK